MSDNGRLEVHGKGGVVGIEIVVKSSKIKKIVVQRASSHGHTVLEDVTRKLQVVCQF